MRRSARTAASTAIAALALTALSLGAASPASAHTNNIYGFVYQDGPTGIATYDRLNADATVLPDSTDIGADIRGIEVSNETGTGVGFTPGDPDSYFVFGWDHSTGAVSAPTELTVDVPGFVEITDLFGLDTLPNGTLITWVQYSAFSGEFPAPFSAIATLNPATGELTPVIDMSDLLLGDPADYRLRSLATDPISGQTFAFLSAFAATPPAYVGLNIAAGTHGDAALFNGTGFEDGFVSGADFDADGTLFFIYGNDDREIYELSSVGAPSTWDTAARHYIGDAAGNLGINPVAQAALTIEITPALASTGSSFPLVWLVAGTVAVLVGGLTVVTARRRKVA
jgi:hypothetical protein